MQNPEGAVLHTRSFDHNDQQNLTRMIKDLCIEFGRPNTEDWGFYCLYAGDEVNLKIWFNDPRLAMMYVLKFGNSNLQ
jgi:hypothetical protein